MERKPDQAVPKKRVLEAKERGPPCDSAKPIESSLTYVSGFYWWAVAIQGENEATSGKFQSFCPKGEWKIAGQCVDGGAMGMELWLLCSP